MLILSLLTLVLADADVCSDSNPTCADPDSLSLLQLRGGDQKPTHGGKQRGKHPMLAACEGKAAGDACKFRGKEAKCADIAAGSSAAPRTRWWRPARARVRA